MCGPDIFYGCLTVRQKVWEAIFIEVLLVGLLWETFFHGWKEVDHTHTARLPHTHVCVCACMHEPERSGALPLSAPTWAARGVFCFMFCFREPSPVLRKCCRKQWELTPSSASVPLKKGLGLSGRRVEGGREGGCQPGYVTAMWVVVDIHTHTQPQSRLLFNKLFLYTLCCWRAPSEVPRFGGDFLGTWTGVC